MNKVITLAEAVASIPSGAHVALSGFATARCTMAFAHEVIRQRITPDGLPVVKKAGDSPLLLFIPQEVNPVPRRVGAFEKDRLGIAFDLRLFQFDSPVPEDAAGQFKVGDPDGDMRLVGYRALHHLDPSGSRGGKEKR